MAENVTVYFDIGSAIATIAILIALTSNPSPLSEFRWNLGSFKKKDAYWLFSVGVVIVICASLAGDDGVEGVGGEGEGVAVNHGLLGRNW